jgi:hypothetical protein
MNSASAREIPSVAMWCADDKTFPVIVGKPKLEITQVPDLLLLERVLRLPRFP